MQARLNAYLNFKDNSREAMEFYQTVFGGKLEINTFKEFGMSQDPSEDDKVMHSQLEADNGIIFMGSDTPDSMEFTPGTNMVMALNGDDESTLRGYWDKLSEGGMVTMPLENAPWGDTFGMLVDKYGVSWMVDIGSIE